MATENRFDGTLSAVQRAVNRVAARIAGLSFWQFVLLAIILLAAAGISEGLWDKPARHRIQIKKDGGAAVGKRDSASRQKDQATAEIQIDENGVRILRKARPETKIPSSAAPSQDPEKPAAVPPATDAAAEPQDKASAAQAPESGTKEVRIGNGLVVVRKRQPGSGDADNPDGPAEVQVQLPGIRISEADAEEIENITVRGRQPPLVTIALLLVLALFVMRMFARAQQRAEQKADAAVAVADHETLQRQIVEARLQLLQAQVEPHFLFNTLAAVEHLIETAPARAAQMQRHLIEYLRAALPRMRQQTATLGQEVELCVSYLRIMQMRMEERLQFEVEVPAGLSSASFPPMMIQSLVENSIRHGLEPKPEGGSVKLRAEVRDGKLCVTVEDTGLGFSPVAQAGIGLANIRERLHQLFGTAGALTMEPNQPSGTRATITVPYAVA